MLFRKYFYHIHFLYMLSDLNRFLKVNKISPMTTKKALKNETIWKHKTSAFRTSFMDIILQLSVAQMKSVQTFYNQFVNFIELLKLFLPDVM